MTEKEFRQLVTDLEITQEDKNNINSNIDNIKSLIQPSFNFYKINDILLSIEHKNGFAIHGEKFFEFDMYIEIIDKPFLLAKQVITNDLFNQFVVKFDIQKLNLIKVLSNSIIYTIDNATFKINLCFVNDPTINFDEYNALKQKFMYMAFTDFKLTKNTVQIIKKCKYDLGLTQISDYQILLLLYYGLSENFVTHTYEAYLKEFNHAVDDLLKGTKIDQDDNTYKLLNQKRQAVNRSSYMIVDIAKPEINLVSGADDITIQDFRKLKKAIQKLIDLKTN